MHMWHHVTNHLIVSNDKDSNSENRIKLRVRDTYLSSDGSHTVTCHGTVSRYDSDISQHIVKCHL
jgi:hypothetical protein